MSKFIVLEGIDGCGTTTQTSLLGSWFFKNYKNYPVILTREPTYNRYGMEIRNLLSEGKKPEENGEKFLELFVKDRKEQLKMFEFINAIIISDRHKHSTYAYQQAQGMSFEKIHKAHMGMKTPDITMIIDVPVNIALKRIGKRNRKDVFEQKQFLEKVQQNYLKMPQQLNENIVIINGNDSKEKVLEKIVHHVEKIL